jgi:hypothetical protein
MASPGSEKNSSAANNHYWPGIDPKDEFCRTAVLATEVAIGALSRGRLYQKEAQMS